MKKQDLWTLMEKCKSTLESVNNYSECLRNIDRIQQEIKPVLKENVQSEKIIEICKKGFQPSRLDGNARDYASELYIILLELQMESSKKIVAIRAEANKRHAKKGIWFWIIIICIAGLGLVVAGLGVAEIIDGGWEVFNVLAIFDVTLGCVGFIIERILDHKNSKMNVETDTAISATNPIEKTTVINKYKIYNPKSEGDMYIGNRINSDK